MCASRLSPSVTRDNELSFDPHEGKGGADRRDSWNRLPVNNLCERAGLRKGAAPTRTAIEITESSSEGPLYSEVRLWGSCRLSAVSCLDPEGLGGRLPPAGG